MIVSASRVVDLSLPVSPELGHMVGHPPVVFEAIDNHEEHGKSNTKVSFSIHSAGTHVDAPYHFFPDMPTIDQLPPDRFIRPGVCLDLRPVIEPRSAITAQHLESVTSDLSQALEGAIVILHTGWLAQMHGKDGYWGDNPYISPAAAEWLVVRRISAVGLDCPPGRSAGQSVSMTVEGGGRQIHRIFLGAGVPLIENLTNLDQLPATGFTVVALPIKFVGADGGSARAVALLE